MDDIKVLEAALAVCEKLIRQPQIEFEEQFAKVSELSFIQEALVRAQPTLPGYIEHLTQNDEELTKFFWAFLAQLVVQGSADLQTMWGLLRNHDKENPQNVLDAIEVAINSGLCLVSKQGKMMCKYALLPEDEQKRRLFMYPLPSIIPYRKLRQNQDQAYQVIHTGSPILNAPMSEVGDRECALDVLNKMQSVGLHINMDVATHISQQWDFVSTQKMNESGDTYHARLKNFNNYCNVTMKVLEQLRDETIYLAYKYDKRGRIYDCGYHIHSQGQEWNKAVIEFNQGETIDE